MGVHRPLRWRKDRVRPTASTRAVIALHLAFTEDKGLPPPDDARVVPTHHWRALAVWGADRWGIPGDMNALEALQTLPPTSGAGTPRWAPPDVPADLQPLAAWLQAYGRAVHDAAAVETGWWTGMCPHCSGSRPLAAYWTNYRPDPEFFQEEFTLKIGYVPREGSIYEMSSRHKDRFPIRGRELEQLRQAGFPIHPEGMLAKDRPVMGPKVEVGALVRCHRCKEVAEVTRPESEAGSGRITRW